MNPINATDTNLYEQLGLTRPAASTAPENELGADAFLTLMLAQLRNQDPLQPMENGEFLSQLAQFNTVTGIQELQGSFEGVAQGLQSDRRLAAAALVDRQVLVPSTQAQLAKDVPLEAVLQLNTPAERVIVRISDASGQLVQTLDLGPQGAGEVPIRWNGETAGGATAPPGSYRLQASAADGEGRRGVELAVLAARRVESVTLAGDGGEPLLNLDDGSAVALGDVRRVG